jgi:hypothetical protein
MAMRGDPSPGGHDMPWASGPAEGGFPEIGASYTSGRVGAVTSARRTAVVLLGLLATLPGCRAASAPPTSTPAASGSPSAASSPREAWLEAFARGYFPGRSGQVFIVPREGEFIVRRNDDLYAFMHGSPWPYDTHVPMLLYGPPFVRTVASNARVAQQDLVPTLAALLGATPPSTAVGRRLPDALAPGDARPRAVVLLVLDGARADYFDTYKDAMPTLSRLRAGGAWFGNAHVTSSPTLTAVGHANLGTGAEPRTHGLVVNNLYNRVTGKAQEAYEGLDPGEMMALTLADVWNIQTDGKAVIVGQGGAIRATAGLVGHGGCVINGRPVLAASYSTAGDGGWETNTKCYTMAEALKPLTAKAYWTKAGGQWMGHDIASTTKFRASAVFQQFEGDAIAAVLESVPIGADDIADLALVNLKGPDYVGHAYGPASAEIKEELAELDRQVARVLQILEKKAGAGRFVVAFCADHGMPGEPKPGGRKYLDDIKQKIEARFGARASAVVQYFDDAANDQIYLDTAKLGPGVTLRDVAAFLEAEIPLAAAFTEDEVRAAQLRLHPSGR